MENKRRIGYKTVDQIILLQCYINDSLHSMRCLVDYGLLFITLKCYENYFLFHFVFVRTCSKTKLNSFEMTLQSSNTFFYLQIKFVVNETRLHTVSGTILIVWNMEAVHIPKRCSCQNLNGTPRSRVARSKASELPHI
jgi:hypothetical protein